MGTTVPSLSLSQGFCKPRDVKQNALKFETYIMPTIKEILLLLSLRLPGKAPTSLSSGWRRKSGTRQASWELCIVLQVTQYGVVIKRRTPGTLLVRSDPAICQKYDLR